MSDLSRVRIAIAVGVLVSALMCLRAASGEAAFVPHRTLGAFPRDIAGWHGTDLALSDRIVQAAGVDEYIDRTYSSASGAEVELYIGFYRNQRTDKWIHSPKNCLPAAGWEPVRSGEMEIRVGSQARIRVNDYLIQNGLDRLQVLYWYQGRGRATANEYKAKLWLMYDAATRNRTDGALIRVLAPVRETGQKARDASNSFVAAMYPTLNQFVP
jgi:EpsI family protein